MRQSSGLYNFRTFSDDGVRLFIDGVPVVDEWRDYPMTNHYGSIELTEGIHSLVYEYYENGGGAQCYLLDSTWWNGIASSPCSWRI